MPVGSKILCVGQRGFRALMKEHRHSCVCAQRTCYPLSPGGRIYRLKARCSDTAKDACATAAKNCFSVSFSRFNFASWL